eukprot:GFUD01013638.1.p1 GENE.GFUD01013638.1~~GFUD01013638.1.p1  ORF type:complete len:502 (+),score=135.36 GFUD01013638.1:39-1508(+)
MPADPCLVTVRAGPAASKGYENFVANKLKDEVLKEITSNLQEELKEDALNAFKDSVKDGYSIKDCISKVQNDVLPKVPNERNKFFIKFTYDNQLQIEIGVNKFKNGNAQFYHKIGVAPKETPEIKEHKELSEKRKEAMQELKSAGGFPFIKLKKQTTNDKSSPFVSGKVSNPHGGWDDVPEYDTNQPPHPTNMQTVRARTGWAPEPSCQTRSSRPRVLGDLFSKQKPNASKLRCRSVGRPQRERLEQNSEDERDRSISPLGPRGKGRGKGALGDCFRTGIRPTKAMLRPAGSPVVRRGSFKLGQRDSVKNDESFTNNMMKHIKIQVEQQNCPDNLDDEEWNENCVEIEEMSSSDENMEDEKNNTEDVSCEKKESIFITEAETEPTYTISQPLEHDFKKIDTPFQEEYPIQNLRKFNLPDQSLFSKKINPLPPLEDFDGWHGPVQERTRTVPNKCFGKLELSCKVQPTETKSDDFVFPRPGWITIPIQRL